MENFLKQDIQFLTGVGPVRGEILRKEISVHTFEDLLYYFPFRYIDKSKFYKVREIHPDLPYIQIKGSIKKYSKIGSGRGKRIVAAFGDETGTVELVWFKGAKWIPENYPPGKEIVIFGKPSAYNRKLNIVHPEIEDPSKIKKVRSNLQAVYSTTEKMKDNYLTSKAISKLQANLLEMLPAKFSETLPYWLLQDLKLVTLDLALKQIHFPDSVRDYKNAELRLKFEELFYIQLNILQKKTVRKTEFRGNKFSSVGDYLNSFYKKKLPFELTDAQKKVLREIRADLGSGIQMNRLLQGDVGSGKTLVALMSMLIALDNNYQACLMAPTEILANQHFMSISNMLKGMDVKVDLLTGSTKKRQRDSIHEDLENGSMQILIGTHALLEDVVQFSNLGLVIIDEQHRFGVAQRARLWKKSKVLPHVLVMTATPIPRTLSMTLYGDLDVSVIDELPPGRKPIITKRFHDNQRLKVFGFLKKEISVGRQVYIVYPLIKESEKMDYKDLEDGLESIARAFPPPDYQISVVHGKMKSEEKEISMRHFVEGRTNIMVSTTVIEVGVDVANASIMVIESAERFGLSQLHQLRGRVGRGAEQSYCILMSGYKLSDDGRKRLETMVSTNDGFEIAEVDLKLRGPGDLEGTQQSGIPFNLKIAHLGKDQQILTLARDVADKVLEEDPNLGMEKNFIFRKYLKKGSPNQVKWEYIS
ncbi:MAG: ATP-dependent DNA helicase RecG [Bacteroidales bacterium]|nr:ATP-dependent DNA helicase RecG [Bacteroidales bacterium]